MKRKQFVAIMMSMIVAAACLPMNSVGALAAENTGEGITDIAAVNETEEVEQEEPEISAGEMTAEDRSEAEEVGDKEDDETYTADTAEETSDEEVADAEKPIEITAETSNQLEEPEDTVGDVDAEEVQQEIIENDSDDYSYKNKSYGTYTNGELDSLPDLVIDDPIPPGGTIIGDFSLSAPTKVTTTNVASGLKVRWEPVSGADGYVVYRVNDTSVSLSPDTYEAVFFSGNAPIKSTTKTEITDTEVKYENGSKFTYKVAAVSSRLGESKKTRSSTYYRLLPVGITSVKSTSAGKMTVTYDKNEKGSGYVVRYGLKSDMSDAKVITVKDPATTVKTFSGLTEGKTYYVQVRSYKIENGIRYYSGYCTTKTVKIAKSESASSVKITFNGSQTIAVGTTRRIYVSGAGSNTVAVSVPKNLVVKISKDSTSYIVTGNKAGSSKVSVAAGSDKKSFNITVLSDDQIANRVYERVKKDCPECRLWDHIRDGKCLVVSMHIKSMGEGAIASDIRVNLQTGRAVFDLPQDYMDEFDIKAPRSFLIW